MKSKKIEKKVKEKDPSVSEETKETNGDLRKEEIKEIVAETVEEVLKEQSEKKQEPSVKEESSAKEESPEVEGTDTPEEHAETEPEEPAANPGATPEKESTESTNVPHEEPATPVSSDVPADNAKPDENAAPVMNASVGQEMQQQENGMSTTPVTPSKSSSTLKLFILFLILGIALGGVALWYTKSHNILSLNPLRFTVKPTPLPTKAATLSPTSAPAQVNVSSYKVSILNGSGVSGAAAKAKTLLTDAGFTVTNTGNANTSNFKQTIVEAKSTVSQAALEKLTQTLEKTYVVSPPTLPLDSSQSADIVVTIGSSTK